MLGYSVELRPTGASSYKDMCDLGGTYLIKMRSDSEPVFVVVNESRRGPKAYRVGSLRSAHFFDAGDRPACILGRVCVVSPSENIHRTVDALDWKGAPILENPIGV